MTQEYENFEKNAPEQKTPPKKWAIILGILLIIILGITAYLVSKSSTKATPVVDTSWQKIQDSGVLRVGTSADYPPFSYYNDQLTVDGFDIALIHALGNKLGVAVEITDYAFEGLPATLQIDQADVVIAALSVTSERESQWDFSNVYYVGSDGILAREDFDKDSITTSDEMAGLRIGVQEHSIYETWVRENLVTGKISEDQLFTYAKPEHAVNDLKLERLDLVMMDLEPATLALAEGGLKLVGQGLNQQRFAIALPLGANALKDEINRALLELMNEGVINQLASQYLGLNPEDLLPTPTLEPTSVVPTLTPEPTAEICVDGMKLVKDLNYDDHNLNDIPEVRAGETFQKGWRLQNTGTCAWTDAYTLKFVRGNNDDAQMQGESTQVQNAVASGQEYDIYVDLVAPENPGEYIGYWQIFNADGVAFGETIWVAVKVVSETPVTPTPPPELTATPPIDPTLPPPTATEVPPEPTSTEIPAGADLQKEKWVLKSYQPSDDAEAPVAVLDGVILSIIFEEDYTNNGNAGCNSFTSVYATDGTALAFEKIAAGKLTCGDPAGIMEQEARYLTLLEQVEEYRLVDNRLELLRYKDENGERKEVILLVFEKTAR